MFHCCCFSDAIAFTILARDPEGLPLTYELTGTNSIYFTVNKNNGTVFVQTPLDREVGHVQSNDPNVDVFDFVHFVFIS